MSRGHWIASLRPYMSYELANAAGQLPTFVEACRTTHEHPHLPHTARG
jgi:hypothetical protein